MLAKESVEKVHVRDSNVPRYLCRGHAQAEEAGRQGNRTWRRLNGGHRAGPEPGVIGRSMCSECRGAPPCAARGGAPMARHEKRHGEFRVDERDA